jgi:hypothetical protein
MVLSVHVVLEHGFMGDENPGGLPQIFNKTLG